MCGGTCKATTLVRMPVVQIREMPMGVRQRLVSMLVRVGLGAVPRRVMRVTMVFVVPVCVRMRHRLVDVLVLVTLRQVQPDADDHERRRYEKREVRAFA